MPDFFTKFFNGIAPDGSQDIIATATGGSILAAGVGTEIVQAYSPILENLSIGDNTGALSVGANDQNGGFLFSTVQGGLNYILQTVGNSQIINIANVSLNAGNKYSIKTSISNLNPMLPSLSTVSPGSIIEIQDIDYYAYTNPQTIHAYYGDGIIYQDLTAASYFYLSENGVCLRFISNTTYWRVIYYGG